MHPSPEAAALLCAALLGFAFWTVRLSLARRRALRTHAESEANHRRFAAIVRNASDAIIIQGPQGRILSWNRGAERMYGYREAEALRMQASQLSPEELYDDVRELVARAAGSAGTQSLETVRVRKGGGRFHVSLSCAALGKDGSGSEAIVTIERDISDRVGSEEKIRALAFYDSLTRLPNRQLFRERLQAALESAQRYGRLVGLLFVDLDRFKQVNDTLGHTVGDRLLCEVAERLMGSVRRSDYVARALSEQPEATISRLGGDEFTILLTEIGDANDAAMVAKRALDSLEKPFSLEGQEILVSASIGIAVYPFDGDDAETLLRNADTAMYQAKAVGANNCQFYTPRMNSALLRRLKLGGRLSQALARGELSLRYQPMRDARSGRLVGAEALLRWEDAQLGSVSPDEFIPVAEETGLIIAIGEWVLRTACIQSRRWRDAGYRRIRISVNLSGQQLRRIPFADQVGEILRETGASADDLDLEITESTIMQDDLITAKALKKLHAAGVGLTLDDFGTGYSSLSYLRRFPIDRVKIDRSFVAGVVANPDDAALTAAIIAMAHSLRLPVVAEGVETLEQAELLRQGGCDEFQGYLFSPPVPADQFGSFLEREKDA